MAEPGRHAELARHPAGITNDATRGPASAAVRFAVKARLLRRETTLGMTSTALEADADANEPNARLAGA